MAIWDDIIPPEDVTRLEEIGVARIFGPGTNTGDIVKFIRERFPEE